MGSEDRREDHSLIGELYRAPQHFDFFQAVRVLVHNQRQRGRGHDVLEDPARMDVEQREDQIRFLAHASLSFPAGQISRVREMRASRAGESGEDVEMVVTFLGLTGPSGVLPRHYSELLIQRIREKDFALRDFLDLFQDRLVSLFYQSWKKHRLPIGYENWQFDGGKETLDLATWALYCLVGLGTDGLRGRLSFDDRVCLYFSGHYAHSPSSAIALECLLGEYLELPVCVQQLQGQWLLLDRADQAQLPDRRYPDGHNNQLGLNLIVGDRVWDVQSKFQLRIGPLRWGEFRTLLPIGRLLPKVCDLTRLYVGPELDYDIQLVLDRGEVPESQLSPSEDQGLFLGWTTWLCGERLDRVASDAVFAAIESPVRR